MPPSSDVYMATEALGPSRHCVFTTWSSLLEVALQGYRSYSSEKEVSRIGII
jgi:hypothetical protein